jgi:hypothetical protein
VKIRTPHDFAIEPVFAAVLTLLGMFVTNVMCNKNGNFDREKNISFIFFFQSSGLPVLRLRTATSQHYQVLNVVSVVS